ncbi:MAG: FHIPEP family type III secretion protein [Polyangiales bacterium]
MTLRNLREVPREAGVFVAVGALILLLVLPLPGWALDGLLALNLGAAVLTLLVAARATSNAMLGALPSVLLLATVARLAIEVAATRAILTRGDAGALIPAVGRVALGGDWVVGAAVFAVLVGVQYLVVTRGAERVAEVAARFALDALPGRQMSLEAAVRAGLIDGVAASRERAALADESAFHASMDGAMKFVRGDALAGALIAAVNLLGGAAVGTLRDGSGAIESLRRYGVLAVGEGLLAQVPSLLCALAAALAVTRAQSPHDVPRALSETLLSDPRAARGAAAVLALLGLLPGIPLAPFAVAAAALAWLSTRAPPPLSHARLEVHAPARARSAAATLLRELSREAREALGCAAPAARVVSAERWAIALDGVRVATCTDADEARRALRSLLLTRPSRWFGVDDAARWIDELTAAAPALVGAAVPRRCSPVELTAALRVLLDSGVPISQGRAMLQRLVETPRGPSTDALAEILRGDLAASISLRWAPAGELRAIEVAPLLADAVIDAARGAGELAPGPALRRDLREALDALPADAPSVVVTSDAARRPLERALRAVGSELTVLSLSELEGAGVERVATLGPRL